MGKPPASKTSRAARWFGIGVAIFALFFAGVAAVTPLDEPGWIVDFLWISLTALGIPGVRGIVKELRNGGGGEYK